MATIFSKLFEGFGADRKAITWLLVINIAVSAAVWLLNGIGYICRFDTTWLYTLLSLPANLSDALSHGWTFLSYQFTQFSPLHLLFNMIWLFWFGGMLADLSSAKVISIYIGGGLAGAFLFLAYSAFSSYGAPALCGSSASVMAIMTAAAMLHPNLRIRLSFIGTFRLKWIATATCIITLLGFTSSPESVIAHAGGGIFGLLFGIQKYIRPFNVKIKRRRKRENPFDKMALHPIATLAECNRRLDELLDKIRLSGYDSLSANERRELKDISSRLRDEKP